MKVIHKYPIKGANQGYNTIFMPKGAKIISVDYQAPQVVVWAIVDPINKEEPVGLLIAYTGVYLPADDLLDRLELLSTVQAGPMVLHVFKIGPENEG